MDQSELYFPKDTTILPEYNLIQMTGSWLITSALWLLIAAVAFFLRWRFKRASKVVRAILKTIQLLFSFTGVVQILFLTMGILFSFLDTYFPPKCVDCPQGLVCTLPACTHWSYNSTLILGVTLVTSIILTVLVNIKLENILHQKDKRAKRS